jgi:hypothetical protein
MNRGVMDVTAQEVTRDDDGTVRIRLNAAHIPVGAFWKIALPEPVTVAAGEHVVLEVECPQRPATVLPYVSEAVTVPHDWLVTSVHLHGLRAPDALEVPGFWASLEGESTSRDAS